ncbi:MAG TPA: DUF2934 domain-containing protein [Pseudomonas xinjiangensis]|uniref:DUF2934 domain-containing protein n=2 Tax=root TaxID=1 RepID=A0A7V1BMQ6_9GAMM|nr:DUF2934 domain-containing protein [Halopseudomonas xinjiangensis]HEC46898.1 DUF2934 domain-containing protein [Halopseudomonas xinjiangensis]
MSVDEKRIHEFAYQIWLSEGQPEGQEARHWEMARKLAEAENQEAARPATRTRKVTKPKAAPPVEPASEKPAPKKPRAPRAVAPKAPKAPKA